MLRVIDIDVFNLRTTCLRERKSILTISVDANVSRVVEHLSLYPRVDVLPARSRDGLALG